MGVLFIIIGGIIVFTIIVLVHELGHFIVSKKSGVKVEEFAVGLPPRIWSKKKGDTTYAVNAIPFGGYVKLLGEDGSGENDPQSMASKPAYIKILILVAGVAFNFFLAYIIIVGVYIHGVNQPIIPGFADQPGVNNSMKTGIESVEKGTPAEKEGLVKGDVIQEVDGKKVSDSSTILGLIQERVNKDQNAKINLTVLRDGKSISKEINTYKFKQNVGGKEVEVNRIGVLLETTGQVSASPLVALRAGITEIGYFIPYYLNTLSVVLGKMLTQFQVPQGVHGPIGIFELSGTAVQSGASTFVQWIALLSVAIGIVNILPILPLDGGHIFIVIIESIIRRKVPQNVKVGLSLAGWAVFGIFLVVITLNDLKII